MEILKISDFFNLSRSIIVNLDNFAGTFNSDAQVKFILLDGSERHAGACSCGYTFNKMKCVMEKPKRKT